MKTMPQRIVAATVSVPAENKSNSEQSNCGSATKQSRKRTISEVNEHILGAITSLLCISEIMEHVLSTLSAMM